MKLFFVVLVSAVALVAAEPQTAKKQSAPAASKTSAPASSAAPKVTDASKPIAIPEAAALSDDGDYHYTDPQGKKWIYRKTPFGVTRMEDTPERAAAKEAAASGAGITATEDGDTVRFERKGPFGIWKWEKKKSEMDDAEKAALQRSQTNNKTASKQD